MRYTVAIDGREVVVEVDGERVTVDGTAHVAALRTVAGTPLRHLVVDGRSVTLPVEGAGQGRWVVTAHGERLELEVVDERTRHIRSLAGPGAARHGAAPLKAPMPGLVVRVVVEPGQAVAPGAGLVTLEAMKMENELKAAAAGTVRAVHVRPGQAVEKGQLLVEFEAEP